MTLRLHHPLAASRAAFIIVASALAACSGGPGGSKAERDASTVMPGGDGDGGEEAPVSDGGVAGDGGQQPQDVVCGDRAVGDLGDGPVLGSRQFFSAARSDDGALVVWSDGRRQTRGDVMAARVSASGEVLDPRGMLVATRVDAPESLGAPQVAAGAGMYLVVWDDRPNWTTPHVSAARVSASGELLDTTPISIDHGAWGVDGYSPKVVFDGEKFVVVLKAYGAVLGHSPDLILAVGVTPEGKVVRGDASGAVNTDDGIAQIDPEDGTTLRVVAGGKGESFVFWWTNDGTYPTVARLDAMLGISRSAQTLTFPIGDDQVAELGFDGKYLNAAWATPTDVVVQRIDRELTAVDAAPISLEGAAAAKGVELAREGKVTTVSWSEGGTFASAQLAADGSVTAPLRALLPTGVDPVHELPTVVAGNAEAPLVLYTRAPTESTLTYREDAFVARLGGETPEPDELRFVSAPPLQRQPYMAASGERVVMAFRQGDGAQAPVVTTQPLGTDGAAQGNAQVVSGTGELEAQYFTLAVGRSTSLLVTVDSYHDIKGHRLDDQGAVLDAAPLLLHDGESLHVDSVAAAATGDGFFVVFSEFVDGQSVLMGVSVDAQGKVDPANTLRLATPESGFEGPPQVACGAGTCAVAFNVRNFPEGAEPYIEGQVTIVAADSSVSEPVRLGTQNYDSATDNPEWLSAGIAWDGAAFLASWAEDLPPSEQDKGRAVKAVRLDAQGRELQPRATVATTRSFANFDDGGSSILSVFAGGAFTLAWESVDGFVVSRVDRNGKPMGEPSIAIPWTERPFLSPNHVRPARPSLVGLPNGDVLVAFERFSAAEGGFRIVTRSVAEACLKP